ncbi:MAG: glycerate kinase type-2 family protein [Pikeienuella sp.]
MTFATRAQGDDSLDKLSADTVSAVMDQLLTYCRACFEAGVTAADPAVALRRASASRANLWAADGRLIFVAVGKAATPMMQEALRHAQPDQAFLVTNYENAVPIDGVECRAAGHPTPDAVGAAAAADIIQILYAANAEDRVVLFLSGGGSALIPAPMDGVSLADKIAVNDLMLAAGLPIDAINTVRKRLSKLKGGGFARCAAPADVVAFVLSDVPGDDVAIVASGPTVANPDSADAAAGILRRFDIWANAPESIRAALTMPQAQPTHAAVNAETILIGGNAPSVAAMEAAATGPVRRHEGWLDGDVADAAQRIVAEMRAAPRPCTLLYGGETTVVVTGDGKGGRNQELALRVALLLEAEPLAGNWAFLSGGTDGRDGPTDAAGGLVGPDSLRRIRAGGVDPVAALANNDAYTALKAGGALLMTGATGTNVADLQVAVVR